MPTGSPSPVWSKGSEIAGCPVMLKGAVNVANGMARSIGASGFSGGVRASLLHKRPRAWFHVVASEFAAEDRAPVLEVPVDPRGPANQEVRYLFGVVELIGVGAFHAVRADELRHEHFGLLREAIEASGGQEFKNTGDGLFVAFSSASAAVGCATLMQQLCERRYRRSGQRLRVRTRPLGHGSNDHPRTLRRGRRSSRRR